MPYLGDYIGHLLSEVTIARMQADIESVRIAEFYANHPLLRNMPVPRFRLPSLELDIPVVIKQVEEPAAGEPARGAPGPTDMRKAFDEIVAKWLGDEGVRLSSPQSRKLRSVLDLKMASLAQPADIAVDTNRLADEMAEAASLTLAESGGPINPARRPELEEKLRSVARLEFLKLRKPLARVQVLVTTGEIREAGPSEVITRFNLKISEEAFEWTTVDSEGRKKDLLVIE